VRFVRPNPAELAQVMGNKGQHKHVLAIIEDAGRDEAIVAVARALAAAGIAFRVDDKAQRLGSAAPCHFVFEREMEIAGRKPGVFLRPMPGRSQDFVLLVFFTVAPEVLSFWRRRLLPVLLPAEPWGAAR